MALEGLGIAWVPQLSVRAELARGELVVCGGPQWHVPLEIRLYRCALVRKANVRLLWRKLEGGAAGRLLDNKEVTSAITETGLDEVGGCFALQLLVAESVIS